MHAILLSKIMHEFYDIHGIQLTSRPLYNEQATGLDAWASRVKCPARFVSHLHEICIYIYMSCL